MKTIQKEMYLNFLKIKLLFFNFRSNETCLKQLFLIIFVFLIWKSNNFIIKQGHNCSSQHFFSVKQKCNYVPDLMIYVFWFLLND